MEIITGKAAMSMQAACMYLDISRPTLYRLMDTGAIRSLHIGRRRLILREHLDLFLAERLEEADGRTI
jgi:excisionase family DNA binding protein